jgi:hypothetical protein
VFTTPLAPATAHSPASRISHGLDYLTQLQARYQQRRQLPEDNAWRDGAQETLGMLNPAIAVLRDALTLIRIQPRPVSGGTAHSPDTDTGPSPQQQAENLLNQARRAYHQACHEAVRLQHNPEPDSAGRDLYREERINRMLADTINRIFYWEPM